MAVKKDEAVVEVEGIKVKLTNLNKVMFTDGITKGELIKYYYDIAQTLLPHIAGRPLVMKRYPHGIGGEYFYQKECPEHAPAWVKTHAVDHGEKKINYPVCDRLPVLLWLANLGCIEIHAWTSRIEHIEYPDIAVLDLDPAQNMAFDEVLKVALLVKQALKEFNLKSYPKTSGLSGLHIFIPLEPKHTFKEVTAAMKYIANTIEEIYPAKCTTERTVSKRGQKIYLDYLQNTRGKTMAWVYSLRPQAGGPVSTPLTWSEIEAGGINRANFNLKTIFQRLKVYGDLYADLLTVRQNLDPILELTE